MQCREVRDLANAFIANELLVETNQEILGHLESCPDCRAEIAARRALRSRLKTAFAGAPDLAPREQWLDEVSTRLQGANRPTGRSWTPGAWLAIAATVLLAVGAGLFTVAGSRGATALLALARSAVGDHRNCAVRFNLAKKPIPLAQAASQYDPIYQVFEATPARTVTARNGTIEVVDRHSCVFEGRRFAHVVMKYQGELVSLLVTEAGSSSLTRLPAPGETGLALTPGDGYHVLYQQGQGHAVFVVSTGSAAVVRDVADAIGGEVLARLGTA